MFSKEMSRQVLCYKCFGWGRWGTSPPGPFSKEYTNMCPKCEGTGYEPISWTELFREERI